MKSWTPEKQRAYMRTYREANRDRFREYARNYAREHRDPLKDAAYRGTNKEAIKANHDRWVKANPERNREQKERWHDENKATYLLRKNYLQRLRYKKNPAPAIAIARASAVANPVRTRAANRKSNLSRYKLTPKQWEELFEQQGRRCAICNRTPDKRNFHTDHCHKKETVRGILCNGCNLMLGHAKDSVEILQAAITYLMRKI